jgi:hypothetical protein
MSDSLDNLQYENKRLEKELLDRERQDLENKIMYEQQISAQVLEITRLRKRLIEEIDKNKDNIDLKETKIKCPIKILNFLSEGIYWDINKAINTLDIPDDIKKLHIEKTSCDKSSNKSSFNTKIYFKNNIIYIIENSVSIFLYNYIVGVKKIILQD